MSRRLADPTFGHAPRSLAAPDPSLDALTRELIEEAVDDAYARGEAAGRRAAVEEATEAAQKATGRAARAVEAAVEGALAEVGELRRQQAAADAELAARIAALVLGHEPHDGGQGLLVRCRQALERLDDRPISLRAHPDDAATLRDGLVGESVEVVEDRSLGLGEAVFAGRWARAELTREAGWALVCEALGLDGPPDVAELAGETVQASPERPSDPASPPVWTQPQDSAAADGHTLAAASAVRTEPQAAGSQDAHTAADEASPAPVEAPTGTDQASPEPEEAP
ncbi:hypothetical protein ER308_17775 [Egibacter rhizosphaerae]|uniref:Flagellar assembly protein FliH/Type III secretion system HrpE domain-containing protein n=1 Tax=Egibacter rhizosphaerae TaxID=1670831 RepID=A0A411YJG9_9ACTN|nr:hypothetical protein [Egibacter rhizosphaerae]QBI21236.1 hypothetical protein ER308_17775 [Egibacter rhizosphaerae]